MSKEVLRRRGTSVQLSSFTPGVSEIVGDTTNKTLRLGDGTTAGGWPIHKFASAKTTIDTNGIVYASTTTQLTTSSSFTWDGSTLTVTSTSTTANSKAVSVAHSGVIAGTGYSGYFTRTGTSTTNVALYASATGATNNYGLIVENGNVGIGTTGPNASLHVSLAGGNETARFQSTTDATPYITFYTLSSERARLSFSSAETSLRTSGTTPLKLGTNGADALTILNGGNVGIGTTGPLSPLHVNGETIRQTDSGNTTFWGTDATGSYIRTFGTDQLQIRNAAGTLLVSVIGSSGNVGIGTSTFGTSATTVLSIASGTAPTTGPADTVQFYSSDDAVGHTIPSFYCEGTNVIATGQADSASSVRIKFRINGVVVTLLGV